MALFTYDNEISLPVDIDILPLMARPALVPALLATEVPWIKLPFLMFLTCIISSHVPA